MKIKCSLVVPFVAASLSFFHANTAFGDVLVSEQVPALEELSFNPLLYIVVLLAVVTFASVVISLVIYSKYQAQKVLICHNAACQNNPLARQGTEVVFDYAQIETPKELSNSHCKQSDFAVEEAINRLIADLPPHSPKHQSKVAENTAPGSHIKLVPLMKHARRKPGMPASEPLVRALQQETPSSEIDLLAEAEKSMRKIG